ncbi:MAG TPA: hypothetical protein VFK06_09050 [Candidatus Angelobacter sp.]|nr:hypothetical protein [Candidatus Angelobacter sp.]
MNSGKQHQTAQDTNYPAKRAREASTEITMVQRHFLNYQHGETECIQVYNRRPLEELKFLPVGLSVYRIAGKRVIKLPFSIVAKKF